jgi:uncharacterized protein (DUF2236 family)
VEPLGLADLPLSHAEMNAYIEQQRQYGELRSTEHTRRIVLFLRRPPLPVLARPVYRVLFAAAVASIRPEFRAMLGVRAVPVSIIQPVTRLLLGTMRWAVGPESPIEDAALRRLERIGVL